MKNTKRIIVAISVIFFIVVTALLMLILAKDYGEENLSFTAKLAAFYADIIENVEEEKINIVGASTGVVFSPVPAELGYFKSATITVDVTGLGEDAKVVGATWTKSSTPPANILAGPEHAAVFEISTPHNLSGDYYLHVAVYDGEGVNYYSSGKYSLDNTAPTPGTLKLIKLSDGSEYKSGTWTNDSIRIEVVDGTDENSVKSTICDWQIIKPDGTTTGKPLSTKETLLEGEGRHYLIVTTEDYAGNKAQSEWYFINIDKTAPTITLSKESGNWSNSHELTATICDKQSGQYSKDPELSLVSGLKSDILSLKSGGKIDYTWIPSEYTGTPAFNTSNLSYTEGTTSNVTFKTKLETEGAYDLLVKTTDLYDLAGNKCETVVEKGPFKLDKTAPTGNLQLESAYTNTGKVKWTMVDEADNASGVNYDTYCEVILDLEENVVAGGSWI